MCSISGILSVSSTGNDDAVRRMNAAQSHRGPDDSGTTRIKFQTGELVLGNTRLAIIDTSNAGHQPMNDPATGNWLTYNGETYNFKDLRRELSDAPWSSHSDTEVVLRAFGKWGVEAFRRMRGMFALAVWDHAGQQLIVARDPLGIKPLYYFVAEDRFVFASEVRALLASGLIPRRLNAAGVDSYLATGSVTSPETIVAGVKQLLPGHYLQVSANHTIELKEIKFATRLPVSEIRDRATAVALLRSELEESVRLHTVSDVPLGVFLSGGMDSSALVALLSRVSKQRVKTFSVTFAENAFTEEPFAREVARRFNTDHSEIRLSEQRLLELLPNALAAIDQPTMDGINTFVVSRAVKDAGVTVALSGVGGDELFAGYPSFRRAIKFSSPLSKRVLRAASVVGKIGLNGSVQRRKLRELAQSECLPADVYRISRQLFSANVATRMTGRPSEGVYIGNGRHDSTDIVNTISRLELDGYMTNTLLRDTDVMSMAHSLEVRVPLVDTKLVNYVLSLPGEWKLGTNGSLPKPLLADAVADLLPRDFLARPKMGFTLPFEKWLQGKLRNEVTEVLRDPGAGLEVREVHKVWGDFFKKPRATGWSRPWSLYVLARWCELNRVRPE